MPLSEGRPAVAVVLPFHGSREDAEFAIGQLAGLAVGPGDEIVLADNTDDNVAAGLGRGAVSVLACTVRRSVYSARNEGAESTAAPWILFVDADCFLPADLLDSYFDPPPADDAGAVAGAVVGLSGQESIVSRYTRSRGHLDQAELAEHPFGPTAVTANVLIRRAAFERIGGFQELTRSSGDLDICWRLARAGFDIGLNTGAAVEHEHRENLTDLFKQARRIGAGSRWLGKRHPGYDASFGAAFFGRAALGAVAWPLLLQPERGLFKALDGFWGAACDYGMLDSNIPAGTATGAAATIVVVEEFPAAGDPLVAACAATPDVRVEAAARPERPAWAEVRGRVPIRYWEDDAPRDRLAAAARLLARGGRAPRGLAAAAGRIRVMPRGGTVLAEPALAALAGRIAAAAGRRDLAVEELPADRSAAAERIARR